MNEVGSEQIDILVYNIMDSFYWLRCSYVQEITNIRGVTSIPGSKAHLLGISYLKGILFPVFDIAIYLNKRDRKAVLSNAILNIMIINIEKRTPVGMVVDGMPEFAVISPEKIYKVPDKREGQHIYHSMIEIKHVEVFSLDIEYILFVG